MLIAKASIVIFFSYVSYIVIDRLVIYNTKVTMIGEKWYRNSVKVSDEVRDIAQKIITPCSRDDEVCQRQKLLDFVTAIPYKTNPRLAKKPLQVIGQNYGDCDDKSNLYGSLLASLGYRYYFAFVPKHVFVLVALNSPLKQGKHVTLNGINYYYAETTADGFQLGDDNRYRLSDFRMIYDPVHNRVIQKRDDL